MKSSKNRDIGLAYLLVVCLAFVLCAYLLPGNILTRFGFSKGIRGRGREEVKKMFCIIQSWQ